MKRFYIFFATLVLALNASAQAIHLQPEEFYHLMTETTFEAFDSLAQNFIEGQRGYELVKAETISNEGLNTAEPLPSGATTYRLTWVSGGFTAGQATGDYSSLQVVMTPAVRTIHNAVMQYASSEMAQRMAAVLLRKGYAETTTDDGQQRTFTIPREGECYDSYTITQQAGIYYVMWHENR
ncbi:MAG: hypothetical protein IJ841_11435 [Prevotella sp.]|nr:hypothetical protein [Prevotella sp.]